jgi:alpha-galactosidase
VAPEFIILHGQKCTVMLEVWPDCAPLWRHWGARLPDDGSVPAPLRNARPVNTFSLDRDAPLSLLPPSGAGWFATPGLMAHREGRDFTHETTACSWAWQEPGRVVCLRLDDDVAQVRVTVTLSLDPGTDTLTVSATLTNQGDAMLDVLWLAAAVLPLPQQAGFVRAFTGRHNGEFVAGDDRLSRATWLVENRRGLTSHEAFPGALVTALPAIHAWHAGPAWGAQLAWSGNHAQRIEPLDDCTRQWQLGVLPAPGEVRLEPGATLTAPDVLATFSTDGLNGVARNFHAAVRSRLRWPGGAMRPRPVHLNTWEGVYFDLDEARLKAMADAAAGLGVERFVLDDGWFKGRRHDRAGLGDWQVDPAVFPNGLGPLARHVTGLGMEFGLWIEPEMVNPDSDFYRAHPDWALQVAGRPALTARNQLVLDLSNPAVADHLFDALMAVLGDLPVSYLKWDHNRALAHAGGRDGRAAGIAQVEAAWGLMDRLRAGLPSVEIEACAGGGGRIDAGMATRVHRFWTSDCIDAVSRVSIQRGFLHFMPPELMGAHVGAAKAHTTGRHQSLSFRAAVALPGHFGVELDPTTLDTFEQERLRAAIATYKTHRDRLHSGAVWQGDCGDGLVWQAHGSPEALLVQVLRLTPSAQRLPPALVLPQVDPARHYRVTVLDGPMPPVAQPVSGAWLQSQGLPLPLMKAETALLLDVSAI